MAGGGESRGCVRVVMVSERMCGGREGIVTGGKGNSWGAKKG